MKVLEKFDKFNPTRYSQPWVAIVTEPNKIDFTNRVGGYTGEYGKGEAGELYITNPQEGAIYAYGRKDYRGSNTFREYVLYTSEQFVKIEKSKLIEAFILLTEQKDDSNEMEERDICRD